MFLKKKDKVEEVKKTEEKDVDMEIDDADLRDLEMDSDNEKDKKMENEEVNLENMSIEDKDASQTSIVRKRKLKRTIDESAESSQPTARKTRNLKVPSESDI